MKTQLGIQKVHNAMVVPMQRPGEKCVEVVILINKYLVSEDEPLSPQKEEKKIGKFT